MVKNISVRSEQLVGKPAKRPESTRSVAKDKTAPRTVAVGKRPTSKGIGGIAATEAVNLALSLNTSFTTMRNIVFIVRLIIREKIGVPSFGIQ